MRAIAALWLVMLVSAPGTPGDPGAAAIRFLEKTRARELDLEPGGDTALSPQTSAAKRRLIARRLERLARDLGDEPLEAGAVKVDDDMAGVLIRKSDGFDATSLRVFAVALVKRDEEWLAAPVPASFENTGLGFSGEIRRRAGALQDWMLRQQVLDLANLRDQSAERLRRNIEKTISAQTLRRLGSRETGRRFLDACARHNLPEILGLLGGLSTNLPDDWAQRLKSTSDALRAPEAKRPWRLLVSHDVLRVPVHHEEDRRQALLSIACLDPAGSSTRSSAPRVELVHLELERTADGFWRVDPPRWFFQEPSEYEPEQDDSMDLDLLAAFPEKLATHHPPSPEPTARDASVKMLGCLQTGGFPSLVRLILATGNSSDPYIAAARTCWKLHEPGDIRRLIPLAFTEDSRMAATVCQLFSARNPDRPDLRVFHFKKTAEGWLWTPRPEPESEESLRDWANRESADWQARMLADCVELENLPDSGAPAEATAREVVGSWLKAIAAGDVTSALRLTARLKNADSQTNVLRNLGYEMTGIHKNDEPPGIIGIHRGGAWTAVGVCHTAGGKSSWPLYPVVTTPAGPRILIEVDLFASKTRSRDFLNQTALGRLRQLPQAVTDELRGLLQKHQASVTEPAMP